MDYPAAPTLLSAVGKNGKVTVTWQVPAWDGDSNIVSYKIFRGTAPNPTVRLTTVGAQTVFNDSLSIVNGETYYYKVVAVNGLGDSPPSNEMSASPSSSIGKPGAPNLTSVVAGPTGITLSWTPPSVTGGLPVLSYRIYRATAAGVLASPIYATSDVPSFLDKNVVAGATYFYVVCAVNEYGAGPVSNERSTKVAGFPPQSGQPAAPTLLQVQGMNAYVKVSWQPPPFDGLNPVKTYRIYRNGVFKTAYNDSTTSYNDGMQVVNGQTYTYEVSAGNDFGEGPRSNAMTGTPTAVTRPGACVLATPVSADGSVTLNWNPPASDGGLPVSAYRVYRGTTPGQAIQQQPYATLGDVRSFTDTNVLNGKTYLYVVTAVNEMGAGPASNEVSGKPVAVVVPPKPTAPDAPTILGADTEAVVNLSWKPAVNDGGSPVTGYKIHRSTMSGAETLLATLGLVTSYTDRSVVPNAHYYYKVTAVNAVGESVFSNEIST